MIVLFIFNTFIVAKIENISYFCLTLYANCIEWRILLYRLFVERVQKQRKNG